MGAAHTVPVQSQTFEHSRILDHITSKIHRQDPAHQQSHAPISAAPYHLLAQSSRQSRKRGNAESTPFATAGIYYPSSPSGSHASDSKKKSTPIRGGKSSKPAPGGLRAAAFCRPNPLCLSHSFALPPSLPPSLPLCLCLSVSVCLSLFLSHSVVLPLPPPSLSCSLARGTLGIRARPRVDIPSTPPPLALLHLLL
jgi:hypothetical protein